MNADPVEADLEFFLEGDELAQHYRVMERLAKLAEREERRKAQRRWRARISKGFPDLSSRS